ncbi:hypothetical protein Q1695_002909 [Nippostrongylus brasiliensis]|nr:hypothetical protein Q1695_002909 [Nippostrongylus brasiliensis]
MSNPVFLVSIAERRNRNEMDFHNMPAMHDPNVRLSAFNVVSACAIALLLTALVVILVVAYIRAKSRTAFKKPLSSSITVESSLDSISVCNNNSDNNNIDLFSRALYGCTDRRQHCYDSIVAV